jgi:hypothetical protein
MDASDPPLLEQTPLAAQGMRRLAFNSIEEETLMTTRRDFLKGAATGIVFCSCGMLDAARAQAQGPRRLPVVVDGKRIKTIDAHTHCFFHEAIDLMGEEAGGVIERGRRPGDV